MRSARNETTTSEATAALLLEVTPLVMRTIRKRMRGGRAADLSVPQFRALAYLHRHPSASLSDLAEHIGLTLPATSRLVDGLVSREYVLRRASRADRRALELTVAAKGSAMLQATREQTQAHLAERLAALTDDERATVTRALELLRGPFTDERIPARREASTAPAAATTGILA